MNLSNQIIEYNLLNENKDSNFIKQDSINLKLFCKEIITSIEIIHHLNNNKVILNLDEAISESKELFRFLLGIGTGLPDSMIIAFEQEHPTLSGLFNVGKAAQLHKMAQAARLGSLCILTHLCEEF